MANQDLALAYATLILVDAKKELSQANFDALVTKAGVKLGAGASASLAKALKGKDVAQFFSVSGGGASSAPQAVAGKADKAEVKKDDKKDVPPPAAEPEEDVDMGGLFDF